MAELGVFDAIHTARALRYLKPDSVPDSLIEKVIDAGIRAPTGSNYQNWVFVVIKDAEMRRSMGEIYRRGGELMQEVYRDRELPAHMTRKQAALLSASAGYLIQHLAEVPVMILAALKPTSRKPDPSAPADKVKRALFMMDQGAGSTIYPAVQNMILACRALGLGTVLTSLHLIFEDEVKTLLGLPADIKIYALLPIGYPQEGHNYGPVRRMPVAEVTYVDRWGKRWPEGQA